MDPLDPRHGTYAGANQHWVTKTPMCDPCGQAAYRYVKRNRVAEEAGHNRMTPARGTQRRIRALCALGYSYNQIGIALGVDRTLIHRWATIPETRLIKAATADKVAAVYERLSMTLPDNSNNRLDYFRLMARRKGWAPPLSWDDIDNDTAPTGAATAEPDDIDPVVVQRILAGDWRMTCTPAEKTAVCETWVTQGRSLNDLAKFTSWRPSRYYRGGEAA